MEEKIKENKMGYMPINKLLITISLPIMFSMVIQALYNVVDSIFVAKIGENALSAVSLAFPVQNFMIAIGAGTGIGINALVSRSLGAREYKEANLGTNNGILLAIFSGIGFLIITLLFTKPFFLMQTNNQEISSLGIDYTLIVGCFSIGIFLQITFEKLLQATGKTIYSMIIQSTGAIINIILDPIFIFGLFNVPKMGVKGAAVATVIGQMSGALVGLFLNIKVNKELKFSLIKYRFNKKVVSNIYQVGFPSIIMGSLGSVMVFGLNNILMSFTSTATAVLGVYFKLQSFIYMPVFGLTAGFIPIVAYNFGARYEKRIESALKLAIIYSVLIMIIGTIVFQLFPHELLSIFSASKEMENIGVYALRIISIGFMLSGFGIICSSFFQALGHGFLSLIISLLRQMVLILPIAFILSRYGLAYTWCAFPISECISSIVSFIYLKKVFNMEVKPLKEKKA